ncbi:MAG TPA: hypothetical protein PKD64_03220 [Pirellulaceae bacterium]|nr:hypothetical protein [Pirellulaceae bacterium]HMO91181.1 hypothetical protein [Pirellulaceae bacterium]HMP69049.1 hypothetical protein [Pirellulaceae bacterium]
METMLLAVSNMLQPMKTALLCHRILIAPVIEMDVIETDSLNLGPNNVGHLSIELAPHPY